MPDTPTPQNRLQFTDAEIDLLGRTADALSAWMGKPVLAQIVDAIETGFEWVLFAVPLLPDQDAADITVVQVGGTDARLIGNKGGLPIADGDIYDCQYLWAVQLTDLQGIRYIKVDSEGEEVAWTNDLTEIVPFDLSEVSPDDIDYFDKTDDDDTPDDSDFPDTAYFPGHPGKPTLH